MRVNWRKTAGRAIILLSAAQVLLILVSWLVTAAYPESSVRSMLGSEGIRWFFGHFAGNILSPALVWIIVMGIAYGAFYSSGLLGVLRHPRKTTLRQRLALQLVISEFILVTVVVCLLTLLPHAVLLSVTGHLFPGSFMVSLIPLLAFSVCVFSVSYGVVTGRIQAASDLIYVFSCGIIKVSPVFILYILATTLLASVGFVFNVPAGMS